MAEIKLKTRESSMVRGGLWGENDEFYHDAAVAHALLRAISQFPGVTEREPSAERWIINRAAKILAEDFGIGADNG